MHVISKKPFVEAARKYPNDQAALDALYLTLKRQTFNSPEDMKTVFPSLDRMKYREKWWVIDVGGRNLRVMFLADFVYGKILIKHILTHAEYNKLVKMYRETKK